MGRSPCSRVGQAVEAGQAKFMGLAGDVDLVVRIVVAAGGAGVPLV